MASPACAPCSQHFPRDPLTNQPRSPDSDRSFDSRSFSSIFPFPPDASSMYFFPGLALVPFLVCLRQLVLAHNQTRSIEPELFDSLEELSRLVDISYCVGTTGVQKPFQCLSHCAEFPDLELVTTWNTGVLLSDSCGYIALSHSPTAKRIVVAFRGTYSITNTIIDLSAYPQAYVPYPGDDGGDDSRGGPEPPSPALRCENCTVHAGFMSSWLNTRSIVLSHVSAARAQYPDYEISLVGHSLGGAVAALAGLEMHSKGWNPIVTTFGEPMVGNAPFVEYLNEKFGLAARSKANSSRSHRFRRVTHIDDPVPLLPFAEWGYAAHAGEIFITKPDLPPSIEEIRSCVGSQDPRCIAGSDTAALLQSMFQDMNIPYQAFHPDSDPCSSHTGKNEPKLNQQVVLGDRQRRARGGSVSCPSQDVTAPLHPLHWDWNLIPARYRLWELFYAHRDYFWRIGLCVPGGDPTG